MSAELLERILLDGLTDPLAGNLIRNPEVVRDALGLNFQYSQPVEAEVSESYELVEALWGNMSEQDAEFFSLWLWQEYGHAESQLSVLERMALEPMPTVHKKTSLIKVAGTITKATPGLSEAMDVGIFAYMALGELETKFAYQKEAGILAKLGEHGLARVMGKMAHQEGLHLEYQSSQARQRFEQLRGWQQRLVRIFIESQYRPVGVQRDNSERMQGFGNMIVTVSDDEGSAVAHTIQALATEIVNISPASSFVAKRYKECIDSLVETNIEN